jgi:hypothetical protein
VTDAIVIEIEEHLRRRAKEWADPRDGECLLCFVARALRELGCDNTLRWAGRYRDLRAPRATALEDRLGMVGGFCDCEIFLNGYVRASRLDPWGRWLDDGEEGAGDASPPADSGLPACAGARRGSTKACAQWARQPRRW